MKYLFVQSSQNRKTGPIPQTYTSRDSCPPSCGHYQTTCYGEDYYTRLAWGRTKLDIAGLVAAIGRLPKGQLWRHNVAGDLPGAGELVDPVELGQIVHANRGRKGFTYSHKHSPDAIYWAQAATIWGFTVNLSANTLEHADALADLEIGPVVVVLDSTQTENTTTPAGRRVVICPATIRDDVTCKTCGLCAIEDRKAVIGFPAHGTGTKKAEAAIQFYRSTAK
jgi:hypothetical protein